MLKFVIPGSLFRDPIRVVLTASPAAVERRPIGPGKRELCFGYPKVIFPDSND